MGQFLGRETDIIITVHSNAYLNPWNGVFSDNYCGYKKLSICENLRFPRNVAAEGFMLISKSNRAIHCVRSIARC